MIFLSRSITDDLELCMYVFDVLFASAYQIQCCCDLLCHVSSARFVTRMSKHCSSLAGWKKFFCFFLGGGCHGLLLWCWQYSIVSLFKFWLGRGGNEGEENRPSLAQMSCLVGLNGEISKARVKFQTPLDSGFHQRHDINLYSALDFCRLGVLTFKNTTPYAVLRRTNCQIELLALIQPGILCQILTGNPQEGRGVSPLLLHIVPLFGSFELFCDNIIIKHLCSLPFYSS